MEFLAKRNITFVVGIPIGEPVLIVIVVVDIFNAAGSLIIVVSAAKPIVSHPNPTNQLRLWL